MKNLQAKALLNRTAFALSVSLALAATLSACATGFRPCQNGGDTTWNNLPPKKERGDVHCYQKIIDGEYQNHGRYIQYDLKGKILLEGEFHEGKKHGTWIQYGPDGDRISEKYFENGVEKPATMPPPKNPLGR